MQPSACAECKGPLCEGWDQGYLPGQAPNPEQWLSDPSVFHSIQYVPQFNGQALYMPGSTLVYRSSVLEYTDFEAEVMLTSYSQARGTLVARVQDRGTDFFYRYQFSVFPNLQGGVAVYVRNGPFTTRLGNAATYLTDGSCPVYRMRLVVDGNRLQGYVNDVLLVDAVDPANTYPYGKVGMESFGGAWYDKLRLNNKGCDATATFTFSATPTMTDTALPTATETPQDTATETPQDTATETPQDTATETPQDTATETPRDTPTASPSATPSETGQPSASPTPSATPSPTGTGTPEVPCLSRALAEEDSYRLGYWPEPATALHLGDLRVRGRATRTLDAGDYVVDSLELGGGARLRARGGRVRLWFRSLNIGGGIEASSRRAGDFWLFSREGATRAMLHGTAELRAAVYAPKVTVLLAGRAELHGAVVCGDLRSHGRLRVSYERSLGQGCAGSAPPDEDCARIADFRGGDAKDGILRPGEALRLYPNPARNLAWVAFQLPQSGKGRLLIMDLGGALVKSVELRGEAGEGREALDLSGLAGGTYLAVLLTDEGMGQAARARFKLAVLP